MHSQRLLLALSLFAASTADTVPAGVRSVSRRPIFVLLVVGIVLDLIVSLALGYVAVQARDAASQAHINRVAAFQACSEFNRSKQADLARWDAIVKLLQSDGGTPQLETFIQGVEQANRTADQPRDCNSLAP